MMRLTLLVTLLGATLAVAQEHGQGPVESGPIQVKDLSLGTHWFGSAIGNKDLVGKVVLVETWGS